MEFDMIKKIALVFLCFLFLTGCYEIESGSKVGQIVSIREEGVIFKTWQATIFTGGFQDGSGSMGSRLDLTIEDNSVLLFAVEAMKHRSNVKITYHRELLVTPCRTGTAGLFMDSVTFDED
jgi:hypothetical protein